MQQMIDWLSAYSFMPHGYCFLWKPEILWMHVISDITIMLAYFSIPFTLLYIMRGRAQIPYKWVLALFSAFIFLCGMTHALSILTIWVPLYALEGVVKILTAAVSLASAVLILPIVPRLLEVLDAAENLNRKSESKAP